jgi:ribosomal protein S6--L-glutamate ligase
LPDAAVTLVETVARTLGIDHAGFDLMECDGHFYLLEFNRLFGNQGLSEQALEPGAFIYRYLLSRQELSK